MGEKREHKFIPGAVEENFPEHGYDTTKLAAFAAREVFKENGYEDVDVVVLMKGRHPEQREGEHQRQAAGTWADDWESGVEMLDVTLDMAVSMYAAIKRWGKDIGKELKPRF